MIRLMTSRIGLVVLLLGSAALAQQTPPAPGGARPPGVTTPPNPAAPNPPNPSLPRPPEVNPQPMPLAPLGGTVQGGTIQSGTVQGGAVQGGTVQGGTVQSGAATVIEQQPVGSAVQRTTNRVGIPVTGLPRRTISIMNVEQIDRTLAGSRAAGSSELDAYLANELILNSQEVIARARFAASRSTSDAVKQTTERMISDHTNSITALQPFASFQANLLRLGVDITEAVNEASPPPKSAATGGTKPEEVVPAPGQVQANAANQESPYVRFNPNGSSTELIDAYLGPNKSIQNQRIFALNFRTRQVLLLLTLRDLDAEPSELFDQAFLRNEQTSQADRLALLTAAEGNVSGPLGEVLAAEQGKTAQHKSLLMDLRALLEASQKPAPAPAAEPKLDEPPKPQP